MKTYLGRLCGRREGAPYQDRSIAKKETMESRLFPKPEVVVRYGDCSRGACECFDIVVSARNV